MSPPPLLPSARPASVGTAVKLILFTLVLGGVSGYLEWSRLRAQASVTRHVSTEMMVTVTLVMLVVILGVMLWLVYMIGKGRNWARITFLVLFLLGLPYSVPTLLRSFSEFPLSASLGCAQILLQIVALVLLFGAEARRWFNASPVPPPFPA